MIRGFWLLCFYASLHALEIESIPLWEERDSVIQYSLEPSETDTSLLHTSGYKSMEIVVGEDGVDVRQGLRLGVVGEASPGWFLDVRLVDEGLAQGELRVTTLSQVDEIFVQLLHDGYRLRLGDFLSMEDTLFSLYSYLPHRSQGASFDYHSEQRFGHVAVGQDQVQTQSSQFYIQPGQRKGYLVGENRSISMVPGAEKVWLEGVLLRPEVDYQIQVIGGLLDFSDSLVILPGNEVRIDYESFSDENSRLFTQGMGSTSWGPWMVSAMGRSIQGAGHSMWGSTRLRFMNSQRVLNSEFFGQGLQSSSEHSMNNGFAFSLDWKELFKQGDLWGEVVWEDSSGDAQRYGRGEAPLWTSNELAQEWALEAKDSLSHEKSSWLALGRWNQLSLGSGLFLEDRKMRGAKMQLGWQTSDQMLQLIWLRADESQGFQSNGLWKANSGAMRPFWNGSVRRMEQVDSLGWEAQTAVGVDLRYSPIVEGQWQASVNRLAKNGNDSVLIMDVQSNLNGQWKYFSWNSLLQGTRTLQGDYWYSTQSLHWKQDRIGISLQHSLGWSASPNWMPVYKRVPAGTGDVAYDSLTQTFIEGVEYGDYILDGEELVDSLPLTRSGNSRLATAAYFMPGLQKGVLRDIRFDVEGEWSADDSLAMPWEPWIEDDLEDKLKGLWLIRYGVDWMLPDSLLGVRLHWDYRTEVSNGISRKEENVKGRIIDLESHILSNVVARLQWNEENTVLRKPTEWSWQFTDWTPHLEWRLPMGWVAEVQMLYRTSEGLRIWQPNGELRFEYQDQLELSLQYGQTRIQGETSGMPWYLTMGYTEGVTHRVEMDVIWRIQDRLDLDFQWLWREQHTWMGSAKAYF